MGTKKTKKKAIPGKHYDNFLDRDHSNDPFVLRKTENAKKALGDGSRLTEFLISIGREDLVKYRANESME